jgi:signal transduction histidine kinase
VRVYALQVLLISAAALAGVYITYLIIEDVLTRQALNEESAHYWALYEANPAQPLPDVANMRGYMQGPGFEEAIPEPLIGLEPGFGRVEALPLSPLVHVSRKGEHTLYLVFPDEQVGELIFYFGLAPLSAVLLTVYALMFGTYRLSQRAISPILSVARALERFDFSESNHLDIPPADPNVDRETRAMVGALQKFSERLDRFIERERTFTRDAGHELRTPIAVMKGSLDILEAAPERSDTDKKTIARMRRVVGDMETLLETLLLLAREENLVSTDGPTNVNLIVAEQIELLQDVAESNGNTVSLSEEGECWTGAKDRVVAIIVSNLLRNAFTYTHDGRVDVTVDADKLTIQDTGVGMSEDELEKVFTAFYRGDTARSTGASGQGLGLALVRRLTEQLHWPVEVGSEPDKGTVFTVRFA